MWPYWENYKKRVAMRGYNTFYLDLGKAVIRAVEEADMVDHADSVCCMAIAEENDDDWDLAVEDILGESISFQEAMRDNAKSFSAPLTARDRITKPYAIEESYSDNRGFFQILVNKDNGKKWDIGRDYEYEGYVNDLNRDIAKGKFN